MQPIHVVKEISVNGHNFGAATTSQVTDSFSEVSVPEPSTMLLLGSGLVEFVRFRMKLKK
jgi:hypothetical protein